jgi:hypothetical protein
MAGAGRNGQPLSHAVIKTDQFYITKLTDMKTKKLKAIKPCVHIVEKVLLNPYNPIMVNLIGAGGTGKVASS